MAEYWSPKPTVVGSNLTFPGSYFSILQNSSLWF